MLLYDSNILLQAIGEKFSFYLFPFGKKFEEIIEEINELIKTDWKVEIIKKTTNEIYINVNKCVFCSDIGMSCDLFKGFLIHSLQKTLNSTLKVNAIEGKESLSDHSHCSFAFILKIEKSN